MKIEIKYPRLFGALESRWLKFHTDYEVDPKLVLEKIFSDFGNHPDEHSQIWVDAKIRSLSVGDFVKIEDQWYQCAPVGWIKTTEDRVNEIMSMSQYDTWTDKALYFKV